MISSSRATKSCVSRRLAVSLMTALSFFSGARSQLLSTLSKSDSSRRSRSPQLVKRLIKKEPHSITVPTTPGAAISLTPEHQIRSTSFANGLIEIPDCAEKCAVLIGLDQECKDVEIASQTECYCRSDPLSAAYDNRDAICTEVCEDPVHLQSLKDNVRRVCGPFHVHGMTSSTTTLTSALPSVTAAPTFPTDRITTFTTYVTVPSSTATVEIDVGAPAVSSADRLKLGIGFGVVISLLLAFGLAYYLLRRRRPSTTQLGKTRCDVAVHDFASCEKAELSGRGVVELHGESKRIELDSEHVSLLVRAELPGSDVRHEMDSDPDGRKLHQ